MPTSDYEAQMKALAARVRDMSREELEKTLVDAVKLVDWLVRGEGCSYANSRFVGRPEGETCREFKTWEQGGPASGCPNCEAREFLKGFDIRPYL